MGMHRRNRYVEAAHTINSLLPIQLFLYSSQKSLDHDEKGAGRSLGMSEWRML